MTAPLLAAEGAASVSFPILTVLIVTPAVGALVVALVNRRRSDVAKQVAVLFSFATGALSIGALALFKTGEAGFQLVEHARWIDEPQIAWSLGLDGISLWMVVLTGILFPIAMLGAPPHHDEKPFYAWLLLLEAGCLGAFLAKDLFLFFVMFEIVLVPMYFLISGWGYDDRKYAATKFFLYTMFGSAFMLVGIISLAYLHAKGGPVTFDLQTLAENQGVIAKSTGRWLFLSFAIAFAIKVPLFPFHTWLPDAHTQAPTAGSVILAGVLLKLGTYGFIRFGIYLFPEAAVWAAPGLVTLGVIGIVYGAVCATMQRDLKRLVAYSSVAHLGFIALGMFALTTQGLSGSVFQMVAHGLSTGALFMLVGMIYDRRHTRQIAALKGLQKPAPIFAAVFTVVMLASIGMPGLNGFVGELVILQGSFLTRRWWTVVAVTGVILAALYLLWAYQRVFHGTPDDENASFPELRFTEGLVMAPLVGLIVFMGVYPKPIFDRIEPTVAHLVQHVEDNSDYREPGVAQEGEDVVPESERQGTDEAGDDGGHDEAAVTTSEGGH
ncbi:MAG: NADH-quinone oxidoreductase subunit M [Actinobacteria bacterium]|nr:NADH-quinone oxidoreductase subunit M [Actinomycetota bacterium]